MRSGVEPVTFPHLRAGRLSLLDIDWSTIIIVDTDCLYSSISILQHIRETYAVLSIVPASTLHWNQHKKERPLIYIETKGRFLRLSFATFYNLAKFFSQKALWRIPESNR